MEHCVTPHLLREVTNTRIYLLNYINRGVTSAEMTGLQFSSSKSSSSKPVFSHFTEIQFIEIQFVEMVGGLKHNKILRH